MYVGKGKVYKRRWRHFYRLKRHEHENKRMQEDYDKYGKDSFIFKVIIEDNKLTDDELDKLEIKYIEEYGSYEKGYNYTKGRKGSKGYKHIDDVKKTHSEYMKGRYAGSLNHFYGKKHTEESRRKISKSLKGKLKGIPKTEEQKRKMRESSPNRISVEYKGKQYSSITEASKDLKISRHTIKKRAKSKESKYSEYKIIRR